ncbi:hypothetical protein, partial [Halodesulfurarchaeum sp.]|uniref:hypothetical protein n=1 Tax=Halodesulfurarchaeum sp. TaxID=1980530 RepID=UPI002FC32C4B
RKLLTVGGAIFLGSLAGCSGVNPLDGGSSGGSGGTGPGGIAIPSGFESQSAPPIPKEGVSIAVYVGSGSSEEALTAFKSAAEDAGWESAGSASVLGGQWSGTAFKKVEEGEGLLIHTQQTEDQVIVTVLHASQGELGIADSGDSSEDTPEETEAEEATPPQSDVEGEDHPDVPRYPGSVRIDHYYMEVSDQAVLENTYLAEATVDEVGTFYDETLPEHGWTIEVEGIEDGEHKRFAVKEDMQLIVTWEASNEYDGYIEIFTEVSFPAPSE